MNLRIVSLMCRHYAHLGWAVQEQLEAILDGGDLNDQNPNALRMIDEDFLRAMERMAGRDLGDEDFRSEIAELRQEIQEHLKERAA